MFLGWFQLDACLVLACIVKLSLFVGLSRLVWLYLLLFWVVGVSWFESFDFSCGFLYSFFVARGGSCNWKIFFFLAGLRFGLLVWLLWVFGVCLGGEILWCSHSI